MTQLKNLLTQWTRVGALLLIGGATAWTIKLLIIVSTNGRIIDTGPAAIFMTTGLLLLIIGSTAIGHYLTAGRSIYIRIIAMILSPGLIFASFVVFGSLSSSLLQRSEIWYASQEAPIAFAVLTYMMLGFYLYRTNKSTLIAGNKKVREH